MTPAQSRAARGLLKWSQDDLAREARVSVVTVRNFENERSTPQRATLDVMTRTLEFAGVQFIPENGGGAGARLARRSDEG
ncbi:helix-turn-helix transcriptional regulator [Enterovirga sp.]|uniref:helix-turn-helix domain-containing protein n=1 Tax=Enterovirga sp. TaxID=2026350 RepID=UPI002C121068|nr:helix-turn-helix transcriptional regulator [Enterovirga sp.]HMO31054.1 helix-turn-helix transcriptional regulator [Enterovirga sp.]